MRTWLAALVTWLLLYAPAHAQSAFTIIPLGVKGGVMDGNLSAYLVAAAGSDAYICLDAGTVTAGIAQGVRNGVWQTSPEIILKQNIKGYFISHPHLDHVSGLILNSVEDTLKPIYAFQSCIDVLKNHYFNWKAWPNFGSDGAAPALKKYTYNALSEGTEFGLPGTGLHAKAFCLSHGAPGESAALLVRNAADYLLYFGDTGPDEIEQSKRMEMVWKEVAPLAREGKLKAIFIEVSYPNRQPDKNLFGHLTPKWLMKELDKLADSAGKDALRGLNVVVTHIKPSGNNEAIIIEELQKANTLGVRLTFPQQGIPLKF